MFVFGTLLIGVDSPCLSRKPVPPTVPFGIQAEANARFDVEGRRLCFSLCMEEIKLVGRPFCQAEGIEIYTFRLRRMQTAEVNDQLPVDVYPHIIVPSKAEDLSRYVGEQPMNLGCEAEIVVNAVQIRQLIVVS
jgi:hypothetical protein